MQQTLELKENMGEEFKSLVGSIAPFCGEATLKLDDDGFTIRFMDESSVALLEITGDNRLFTLKGDKPKKKKVVWNVTIPIEALNNVLKRMGYGDYTLVIDRQIKVSNSDKEYVLPLIDEEINQPRLPKIKYKAGFDLRGSRLRDAIKDVELVDEHVRLATDGKTLVLSTKKQDTDEVRGAESTLSSGQLGKIYADKKQTATYTAVYMHNFLKLVGDGEVKGEFGTETPIHLSFDKEFTEWEQGKDYKDSSRVEKYKISYNFWIAPRVENDMEKENDSEDVSAEEGAE